MTKKISDWADLRMEGDRYVVDYSPSRPPQKTAIDAGIDHFKSLDGDLVVMLSGGADSQFLAFIAKESGVPCRFVSARYNGGMNDYDLECPLYDDLGISIEILDVDIIDFHEHHLFDLAEKMQCPSPHIASHAWLASHFPYEHVVMSGNAVGRHFGRLDFGVLGLERYATNVRNHVTGYFINSSEEIFSALYMDETSCDSVYESKIEAYQRAGVPVIPQESKLHGFERLKEFYDNAHIWTKTKMRYKDRPSKRPYDQLFRYPLERLGCRETITILPTWRPQ